MSVDDLLGRLRGSIGEPIDWRQFREGIHVEHQRATSTRERVALLSAHKALMDMVERTANFTPDDREIFKQTREQDYNSLLIREAMIGETDGNIKPYKLAAITQREVEAGRMEADDELHKLALAGDAVLTPRVKDYQPSLWSRVKGLFGK